MSVLFARLCRWYIQRSPLRRGKLLLTRLYRGLLGDSAFVDQMASGMRLEIRAADHVSHEMFLRQTWEPPLTELLQAVLRPGDTFLDLGANLGYYSLLASPLVGTTGRVIAFEPLPAAADWFRRNLALNGYSNVELVEAAVGEQPGETTLSTFAGDALATASRFLAWREQAEQRVTVPMTTLNAFGLQRGLSGPMVVKMDVEGSEWNVVRGALGFLRTHRPLLVFEILPALAEAAGWQPEELLTALRDVAGYDFELVTTAGLRGLDPGRDIPDAATQEHTDVLAHCPDAVWHRERLMGLLEDRDDQVPPTRLPH